MPKGNTSRTNSNQTQNSTSTVSTPGTAFGTNVLSGIDASGLTSEIQGTNPSWGAIPDTFVPQRTAADAPTQVEHSFVAPNYQPGIDAGLTAANTNAGILEPAAGNLGDYWNTIAAGGGADPRWDAVRAAFTDSHNTQSAFNAGQRALYAGADGAFGSTPNNQAGAFAVGEEERAFNEAMAQLGLAQLTNEQQMVQAAPGQLQQVAGLNTTAADQTLHYGNMQQENLAAAAASGDYNAQVLQNNLHNAQSLGDANAVAAAQEAIAQWQAQFQVDSQGQENLTTQLAQLEQLLGLSRGVPGATTTSSGTATGVSNTRESSDPWSLIGSILSSGLTAFGNSDKRIKKNFEYFGRDARGVRWYDFHYLWETDEAPKHRGVIAQELQALAPDFVSDSNGLLVVDYKGLGEWKGHTDAVGR